MLTSSRISDLRDVIGWKDDVIMGDKHMNGEALNIVHWAVYKNNLFALKLLLQHQRFNILQAGKVPSNCTLANESDQSINPDVKTFTHTEVEENT